MGALGTNYSVPSYFTLHTVCAVCHDDVKEGLLVLSRFRARNVSAKLGRGYDYSGRLSELPQVTSLYTYRRRRPQGVLSEGKLLSGLRSVGDLELRAYPFCFGQLHSLASFLLDVRQIKEQSDY